MVSRVSLQDIINADWSKQYLDNNGEVKNKSCSYDFFGIGPKLVKLLRHVPFIGALFPKADIVQASTAVKAKITELLNNGTSENDSELTQAANKVNVIVRKVVDTQSSPSNELWDAYIYINKLRPQPAQNSGKEDEVKTAPAATPENVAGVVKDHVPATPEKLADGQKEEPAPSAPANTPSTPVAQNSPKPNDPFSVFDEPLRQETNGAGADDPKSEEFVFDDMPPVQAPPLSLLEKTEARTEISAAAKESEKAPDLAPNVSENSQEGAKQTVLKTAPKTSAHVEPKKRRKEQEGTQRKKVVVNVKDGQEKPAAPAKKGQKTHINKKTKN